MGVITSASFAKLLWPGLNKIYGQAYKEFPVEYTKLVDIEKSTKAYEENLGITGFGLASRKTENNSIAYDEESQAYLTRFSHAVWALGFTVTREIYEDDQYGKVGKRRSTGLAFSMRQTKEINVANLYNRGFSSTYTGGDGKEMLATDHPNYSGGTWSNELAVAADLSEASLEQAYIDIEKFTNDRGLKISVKPKNLIIPVDLVFEAERILTSVKRVGTADSDPNALRQMNILPGGINVNHYLTDSDAWFIRTSCPFGPTLINRRSMQFAMDNDFDTENAKFKATERYSTGWTDPRGIYGSPGS